MRDHLTEKGEMNMISAIRELNEAEFDSAVGGDGTYPPGQDLGALGFIVLMEAANSAQNDLQLIMGQTQQQMHHNPMSSHRF